MVNEGSPLILSQQQRQDVSPRRRAIPVLLTIALCAVITVHFFPQNTLSESSPSALGDTSSYPRLGNTHKLTPHSLLVPPEVTRRCQWVQDQFEEKDGPDVEGTLLRETYNIQSVNFNIFYRATAHIFWKDFTNEWGHLPRLILDQEIQGHGDIPLSPKSTWTWVTGDQHLSNFGAWRNRNGDVVFSVNDFDEAAIYDFHIDVLRIAVSICNHALTNGLDDEETSDALHAFTDSYVDTVRGYVGNEDALLFELTPKTAHGELKKFLKKVKRKDSATKQVEKFTEVDPISGDRSFIKGAIGVAHKDTNLADLPPEVEAKIRAAFASTQYGATMMKLGWNMRQWDDDYFTVLDVAGRINSGVGSFGVTRYFVLLQGTDGLLDEDEDGSAVILDVKYEPLAAVERILNVDELAWYNNMFTNAAARVAEGQRRLTSYVDPFTGWVMLEDDDGVLQPFNVRQRSPWKEGFDVDELTDPNDFIDFSTQIAIATATSHVRGSVAKAPADFKNVIASIMKKKANRKAWGHMVERLARDYHDQVLLDYSCFHEFVETKYGAQDTT